MNIYIIVCSDWSVSITVVNMLCLFIVENKFYAVIAVI